MSKKAVLSAFVFLTFVGIGATYRFTNASDHDDGETDSKARALNLTDHLAWKDVGTPTKLNLAMYVNPRGLPGYNYYFSNASGARYEFHISRVTNKAASPSGADHVVLRFTFGAPVAGVQAVTLNVIKDGASIGTDSTGQTTSFAVSQANTANVINNVTVGGMPVRFFAGMRQDTFFFDVQRFFQVRAFLAKRFLAEDSTAGIEPTCDGIALGTNGGDEVHLFNPPSCAPDFTHEYNVSALVAQVNISDLANAGQTTFDTWSTISVPQ